MRLVPRRARRRGGVWWGQTGRGSIRNARDGLQWAVILPSEVHGPESDSCSMTEPSTSRAPVKRMKLRYAGTCRACGCAVPAGVLADYRRATKSVSCLPCASLEMEDEVDRSTLSTTLEMEAIVMV